MGPRRQLRRLTRRSTTMQLPPSISTQDHLDRFGGLWHDLGPVPATDWGPARQVGGPTVDLLAQFHPRVGRVGVLELDGAKVDGRSGWVTTEQNFVLRDHTFFGDEIPTESRWIRLPRRTQKLDGLTVTLSTDFAMANFGHGMVQVLPRLELVEAAGIPIESADHVLVNASGLVRDYLLELGVPEKRIIWAEPDRQYLTERLATTSFPGPRTGTCERSVAFLRERLGRPAEGSGRRIHLPRHGRRRISNEQELEPLLHDLGFESIDPTTDPRDLRPIFASAEAVVGAHGAAFTNLVFCQPGAHVLEIIPTDQVVPFFYTIARSGGLDHRFMTGLSDSHRPADKQSWGASWADLHVDPEEFRTALLGLIDDLGR